MSTVKTVKYQVGTDGTSSNNFTIYQPDPPDGSIRIGVGNADSPTDVMTVNSSGITMASGKTIPASALTGTLPAIDGSALTNLPAASGPAFQAQGPASTQSFSSNTWTKANMTVEDFDTDSCYDAANARFTPTVAGYYWVHFAPYTLPSSGGTNMRSRVYKSGAGTSVFGLLFVSGARGQAPCSGIVYMNGTTDYLEGYMLNDGTSPELANGSASTFAAALIRAT